MWAGVACFPIIPLQIKQTKGPELIPSVEFGSWSLDPSAFLLKEVSVHMKESNTKRPGGPQKTFQVDHTILSLVKKRPLMTLYSGRVSPLISTQLNMLFT